MSNRCYVGVTMGFFTAQLRISFKETFRIGRRYNHNDGVVRPLSIAYFGTDKFSVYSLERLNRYKEQNPHRIKCIDVITRSIKRTGRNLKKIVDIPIGTYANENGINVIRADSSHDITSILERRNYDLAIAVSYGKLIPAKFINSCQYGGLNVHPSLLPKYSGSSPLQYALINDDKVSGVTVQTLHPTKFDQGDILLQSNQIAIEENETYGSLEDKLGKIGSELLVEVVDKRLYANKSPVMPNTTYSLASKILPQHREILWTTMTSRAIKRLNDALGPLYTYKFVDIMKKKKEVKEFQKVILSEITPITNTYNNSLETPGEFFYDKATSKLVIKTIDGYISIGKLKFQYCGEETPNVFMNNLNKRAGQTGFLFSQLQ